MCCETQDSQKVVQIAVGSVDFRRGRSRVARSLCDQKDSKFVMRSAVIAALVGAGSLLGSSAATAAVVAPVVDSGSGSVTTGFSAGSSGGATTTGSGDSGSAPGLERLIFGGPLLCAAIGSAMNANLTCPGTPGPNIPD